MPSGSLTIDIAVCTFRRTEITEALASLARLRIPAGATVGIVVADNDVVPSARERVERVAHATGLTVRYVHCPAGNISLARNACLDASSADILVFLDDDETATPDWLVELVRVAEETDADVVLGPVRALYCGREPSWMRHGDFHSTFPVWVGDEICTGYTCNVLMRTGRPALAERRFDLDLGRSGGEDTSFFAEVHAAGGRIAFAPYAWVEEPVTPERASLGWLARRRFRSGQTHGRLLRRRAGLWRRSGGVLVAGSKSVFCFAAAAIFAASARRRYAYALRGVLHAGVVSSLVGVREMRQYGLIGARS